MASSNKLPYGAGGGGGGQDGRRWVDRPYPPKGIYICICGKRKVVEYKDA